jgi:hypothetical protein
MKSSSLVGTVVVKVLGSRRRLLQRSLGDNLMKLHGY